ncbi:MAG: hypothetical protein B7X82_15030 [Hydrogenophilales bacterium 17-64-65]|nr:MAG: hypothetical protein B7Y27_10990 [Hydrogenophilales bacterium 16-64-40]OZA31874.1 MAG: hypothetical protein B7X82_15030 [Hydrogenophilales bacterium 17-64-65]
MTHRLLHKLHWVLSSQFGFDPRRLLRSMRGLPRFVHDWRKFRKSYSGPLTWMACLGRLGMVVKHLSDIEKVMSYSGLPIAFVEEIIRLNKIHLRVNN